MIMQPTPGPWTAAWDEERLVLRNGEYITAGPPERKRWVGVNRSNAPRGIVLEVCTVSQEGREDVFDRAVADAKLMAAAPDMLACLKVWMSIFNVKRHGRELFEAVEMTRMVIAKTECAM